MRFLREQGIESCFEAVVTMEDAALKPSPEPVLLCLSRLGVASAWMIGDTRDDIVAARAAGVVPIGVVPPGENVESLSLSLIEAGAGRVLESAERLVEEVL
jgi:HAD superfamily phosphatase